LELLKSLKNFLFHGNFSLLEIFLTLYIINKRFFYIQKLEKIIYGKLLEK